MNGPDLVPERKSRETAVCLKFGTITAAIWCIVFSLVELGLFGWQTDVMRKRRNILWSRSVPLIQSEVFRNRFPGNYRRDFETPELRHITAIYVIQVANLTAYLMLLISSCLVFYAIIYPKSPKKLFWPWFASITLCIFASVAYSAAWWSGDVFGYWLHLSIFQFLVALMINVPVLILVLVAYCRRTRPTSDVADNKNAFIETASNTFQMTANDQDYVKQYYHHDNY